MALGNILGSNLFNILFVLGTTATIKSIEFSAFHSMVLPDLIIALGITLLLFFILIQKKRLGSALWKSRIQGLVLLLAYAAYMVFAILRK
jgi:cation:H+ antiporter